MHQSDSEKMSTAMIESVTQKRNALMSIWDTKQDILTCEKSFGLETLDTSDRISHTSAEPSLTVTVFSLGDSLVDISLLTTRRTYLPTSHFGCYRADY